MTIGPVQLKKHVEDTIDINKIVADIDAKLLHHAEQNSIDGAFDICIFRYPEWAIQKICQMYMDAGWHSVKVARKADAFTHLEFVA